MLNTMEELRSGALARVNKEEMKKDFSNENQLPTLLSIRHRLLSNLVLLDKALPQTRGEQHLMQIAERSDRTPSGIS